MGPLFLLAKSNIQVRDCDGIFGEWGFDEVSKKDKTLENG